MKHASLSLAVAIAAVASLTARQAYAEPCEPIKNPAATYRNPVVVTLNADNGDEPSIVEYVVTYQEKEDGDILRESPHRVTSTGIATFRVSKTYFAVTVTGLDATGKEQCSESFDAYKILVPGGGAAKKAAAVPKTPAAKVDAKATPAAAPSPTSTRRYGDEFVVTPEFTEIACKEEELVCDDRLNCHCPADKVMVRRFSPVAIIQDVADRVRVLEDGDSDATQENHIRGGVGFIGLMDDGVGGMATLQADFDIADVAPYLVFRGDIGFLGDSEAFIGCLSTGMIGATSASRKVYLGATGGWCGLVDDGERGDFVNARLQALVLVADNFGLEAQGIGGLMIADEVGENGQEETGTRFTVGGTVGFVVYR